MARRSCALLLVALSSCCIHGADALAAPAPCTQASTERAVRAFVAAFDRGDQAALKRLIAPKRQFHWYSVAGPGGRLSSTDSQERATLFAYLAARHRQHEQIQTTKFRYLGRSMGAGGAQVGNFEFDLVRQARGIPSTQVSGKGAVFCGATTTISVWSQAATLMVPAQALLNPGSNTF
jgi:hypothetical protein